MNSTSRFHARRGLRRALAALLMLGLALALPGCGIKGPLAHPEPSQPATASSTGG